MMIRRFAGVAFASALLLTQLAPLRSAELAPPGGPPILTISGAITQTNAPGEAVFDREMLEALGYETIVTKTPWYDGKASFAGVRLDQLLALVGASGKSVTAHALNDYVTVIPMEDFARYGVILALKKDGAYMSIREKGPLFIMYPFDSTRELQT
jgi:hypothetical protein